QYIESPDVEKEVKRLLSTDAEAVSVRWEVIAEDETKEVDNHGSLTSLDISSPGMSGHKQGHGSSEHDELREIFNDISSSSEDEDERDHHDDEDLNIMDTEEDLERQLQDKLNESDGQQQENEGSNQIGEPGAERGGTVCRGSAAAAGLSSLPLPVMGIQKQIDNLKSKLQETQDRRKRQEDLIMKVENLALKTRLQAVLDEFKQQEEREKQQVRKLPQ
ncbi:TAF7 factor, partial [Crypturellus soui]|nr:TAF7 factor [Crypturellus soui]